MNEIHLSLQPQMLDYVANVLMQRPWAEANPVLAEIHRQVAQQQQQHPMTGNGLDNQPQAALAQ